MRWALALAILASAAPASGDAPTLERVVPLKRGEIRIYRQRLLGLRVLGRSTATRVDRDGRVRWVSAGGDPVAAASLEPGAAPPGAPPGAEIEEVVWAPAVGRARRAWRIVLPPAPGSGAVMLLRDAATGAVLAREDRRFRAVPEADVFEESPAVTPELTRVLLATLAEGAPELDNGAVEALGCADTGACREIYQGTSYHACEPTALAAPDAAGNFIYPFTSRLDPDDQLAEVMAFYQAEKALENLRGLGFAGLSGELHLLANYRRYDSSSIADCADGVYDGELELEPVDTAYFTRDGEGLGPAAAGQLWVVLAQGRAIDYALDGDVVQHEVGHAVTATLAPDLLRSFVDRHGTDVTAAGIHEGYSDLFTAIATNDPAIGEYLAEATGQGDAVRDLREEARCPDDVVGEAHDDSRPFTSGMWAAREAVAGGDDERRRAFDRALLAGWASLGEMAGYERAAALTVMEIEVELGPDAAAEAEEVLAAHGLIDCGGRVVDGEAGKPVSDLPAVPDVAAGGVQPGPFQLRIEIDEAAEAIALEVAVVDSFAAEPAQRSITALFRRGEEPIEWDEGANGELTSNADFEAELEIEDDRRGRAVVTGELEPGVWHAMLVNRGARATVYETRLVWAGGGNGGCGCGGTGNGKVGRELEQATGDRRQATGDRRWADAVVVVVISAIGLRRRRRARG